MGLAGTARYSPYVPARGPVHPSTVTLRLFTEVVAIAGSGRFLSHDKDPRWGGRKDEHVLAQAITEEPDLVLLPSLTIRRQCVKVHVYSKDPRASLSRAAELGRALTRQHDAATGRLVWFLPPGSAPDPAAACTRVQMRIFNSGDRVADRAPGVVPLEQVTAPVRATFSPFADRLAGEGFAFLDAHIREHGAGPVLTRGGWPGSAWTSASPRSCRLRKGSPAGRMLLTGQPRRAPASIKWAPTAELAKADRSRAVVPDVDMSRACVLNWL
jgi:hypothetical protein